MIRRKVGVATALLAGHLLGEAKGAMGEHVELAHITTHVHSPDDSLPVGPLETQPGIGITPPHTHRVIEIRTGPVPNSITDPESGLLLATLPGYSLEGRVWAEGVADNSGAAGHFRVKDIRGSVAFQGSIATQIGQGELVFENHIIVAGGTVVITTQDTERG